MSRIEDIQKQIEKLEKKTQKLQEELEFEQKKTELEYPNLNMTELYWLIDSNGSLCRSCWLKDGFDKQRSKIGNVFLTKEEAEKELDRRILLTKFRQFRDKCNGDWKPDWGDKSEDKFCVLFNHETSELVLNWYVYVQPFESFGCFKNREDAQRAIDLFGDEIKRLFVEE